MIQLSFISQRKYLERISEAKNYVFLLQVGASRRLILRTVSGASSEIRLALDSTTPPLPSLRKGI